MRATNFDEVCLGYNKEESMAEANRCLACKTKMCGWMSSRNRHTRVYNKIKEDDIEGAAKVIAKSSSLPAVCGRVCPQESQCEGVCILGIKSDAVSIGKLERFVADWSKENDINLSDTEPKKNQK